MIKKADILLVFALIVLCTGASLFMAQSQTTGRLVTVAIDDKVYGTYDLAKTQEISIDQPNRQNVISVDQGQVIMVQASCKNQLCVEQAAIDKAHQTIVCLPNHVVLTISGGQKRGDQTDAISY